VLKTLLSQKEKTAQALFLAVSALQMTQLPSAARFLFFLSVFCVPEINLCQDFFPFPNPQNLALSTIFPDFQPFISILCF
jgi:hypothetical protein